MTAQDTFEALKYRIDVDELGTQRYYNSAGQLHREGGPAMVWANGSKEWFVNNERHRIDGPAVEWTNGYRRWFIDGVTYTEEQFKALVKK